MKYTTVIFDLDGTLLNTLDDLADATNYALKKYKYPARTLKEIQKFVGNGVGKLIERALPKGLDNPDYNDVFLEFKKYYAEHCEDKTAAYSGILQMLEMLEKTGIKMAIVSNKLDGAVKKLNEKFFARYISCAIGEIEGIKRKPYPDMLEKALAELNSTKEETVYVGDSEVDVMTAKNADLDCISVLWGFRDIEFLKEYGASIFANTPEDIYKIVVK